MAKRVLVVDDHQPIRQVVVEELEPFGWECREAADGEEALRALAAERFDVVLADIWMPNMNGLDLIRHVRELCPGTPIVAMSGGRDGAPLHYTESFVRLRGVSSLLRKPFEIESLVEALEGALR